MSQTQNVFTKSSWLDYDRSSIWQRQLTLSAGQSWFEGSAWIAALAVILLELASPAAYILLTRLVVWICRNLYRSRHNGNSGEDSNERTNNTANERTALNPARLHVKSEQSAFSEVTNIMWTSRTPDKAMVELIRLAWKAQGKTYKHKSPRPFAQKFLAIFLVALIILCLGIFILLAIGSIESTGLLSDGVVLSDSPKCGVWILDGEFQGQIMHVVPEFYYQQELEYSEYAKHCFGRAKGTDGCNFFTHPDLPVVDEYFHPCPFDAELCLHGSSAYTLTTNLVSSKVLGINVPTGYLFNRTTTCVPLATDGFVKLSQDGIAYEYNYGPNSDVGESTWTLPVNQSWSFPGYSLQTVLFNNVLENSWTPAPQFNISANEIISLIFIQSQDNYHPQKGSDPIFPAHQELISPADGSVVYFNNNPFPTVLVCVDKKEICHPSGSPCYPNIYDPNPESPDAYEKMGYYMLLLALRRSIMSHEIELRGGSALDASSRLIGNRSEPLPRDQWVVEVRAAFMSSLARMQITLRDHILGAAAEIPGFENHIDSAYTTMCTSYKFQGKGWQNVSVTGLTILILSTTVVYILGIETEPETEEETEDTRYVRESQEQSVTTYSDVDESGERNRLSSGKDDMTPKPTRLIAAIVIWTLWYNVLLPVGFYIQKYFQSKEEVSSSGEPNSTGVPGQTDSSQQVDTQNGDWERQSVQG